MPFQRKQVKKQMIDVFDLKNELFRILKGPFFASVSIYSAACRNLDIYTVYLRVPCMSYQGS